MSEMRNKCPQCGRPLVLNETGRIGRCPHHQMWFAAVDGAVAEASQKNAEDAREKEARQREAQAAKLRAEQEQQKRMRASATRKLLLLLVVLIAAAVVVVLFVVRPKMAYDAANAKLAAGSYEEARESYADLGDYKDSGERMLICQTILSLQDNDIDAAMSGIDSLIASASAENRAVLADVLLPVIDSWQTNGISPEGMLQLLARLGDIDTAATLDANRLSYEAHAGLLGSDTLASMADDVDADGADELVALSADYQLFAYEMQAGGNERISIDADNSARCLVAFGDGMMENSVDGALACYLEAHRAKQDETTRQRVALAYNTRATQAETDGSVDSALADARQAVEVSGAAEDFDFYYNMMLRSCTDEADQQAGIARWDAFRIDEGALIQRFDAKDRASVDAGLLRVKYAAALAVEHDPRCYDLLHEARKLGTDTETALNEAIEKQTPGMLLAQLRAEAIEIYAADAAKQAEHQAAMASEIISALQDWQTLGLSGEEVLYLIRFANGHAVSLEGVDVQAIYEAAAVRAAGAEAAAQNIFVNWDGDSYAELLSITAEGEMQYYVLQEQWTLFSTYPTGLVNASLSVYEYGNPQVLAVSEGRDAFEIVGYAPGAAAASSILREDDILNLNIQDNTLTYDHMLPGSIERRSQFSYTIGSAAARPVRTGIEWQEAAYPYPDDAEQTLRRWLEARCYDIPAEQALMAGDTAHAALGFDLGAMSALPAPDSAEAIAVSAYDVQEGIVLLEAVYTASGKEVRAYFAAVLNGDKWQLAGASENFSSAVTEWSADNSLPLLALNEGMNDRLEDKKDVNNYRVFLPQTSEVTLLWQAGTENKSRVAFSVTLLSAEDMTNPIIKYDLTLSAGKQLSNPLFLAPGVYYVSVAPGTYTDVPYTLTLQAEADPYVETEGNDTLATADAIEPNQPYTGALKTAKDVDCYAVTLTEAGKLVVRIDAEPDGQKSARYTIDVANTVPGVLLNSFQMAGNAESAQSCNLYLAPGSYIIQVSKGSHATAAAYKITAQFEAMANTEQEMNNPDAVTIAINEACTGSFGTAADVDLFRFTLDKDSVIQPKLSFAPLETSSRTYVLTIMKDAQTLHTISIGGKETQKVAVPLALPAGEYTIQLKNTQFNPQDYSLFVTAVEAPAAEREFNDALATADVLAVGSNITGVLSHEEDTDYYKLTFAEDSIVTLSFKFPASTVSGNVYAIRLEQNGKSLWNTNVKGSTGGFAQQMQIPAGEYYLRIKPATWISAVYTIELT